MSRSPAYATKKTYRADTMAEALAAVKSELGRDAVILQTRSVRKGGLLGLIGGRSMWEVTASPNAGLQRRSKRGAYVSDAARRAGDQLERLANARARQAIDLASCQGSAPACGDVGREVSELRRLVEAVLSRNGGLPDNPELGHLRDLLRRQEVEDEIVIDLLGRLRSGMDAERARDAQALRTGLTDLVASRIRTVGEGRPARVMALIGPTGVGKTTTIAKLAANFKLRHNRRVGLVTIDTYRIAAVDQLKTYADIIDVPLRAVLTPEELREAIAAMKAMDVILIDTAGRSQNDRLRLGQLRKFLEVASPDETHLVVSATANRACTRGILGQFLPLGANRVILSKLDEADCYGAVLNVAAWSSLAVSYVTIGQEVPDDIVAADARRLAQCIVGGPQA
ncbi:MAG TPA: flagellar biosynthesis protein FlhF [Phycisphaerae bacterium]|nr:flagellar biosynthesis protein FlhF [Phycisphaerae bacterium]HQL75013.1 flagellar biosynthesis protein FlhF [Phycisphaerae bacterium]